MEKIKAGLIGLGSMGKGHFNVYLNLMKEGFPIELVAICDINEEQFTATQTNTNLEEFKNGNYNFTDFRTYTDVDDMLKNEKLDMVSIVAPTYEHYRLTKKCLNAGINVLCEKPMGLSVEQCRVMIETAKQNGKKLMIGQCLRFQKDYNILKDIIDSGKFGAVRGAFFYRGGSPTIPRWFHDRQKGGGAIFDQHIHDVDMVQYLFGMPKAVQSVGAVAYEGSGYDVCATNYMFDDNIMVHTENRWCDFEVGFDAGFRVTFEHGSVIKDENGFRVMNEKLENVTPEFENTSSYAEETKAFANSIITNIEVANNRPEDSMNTIKLALAEVESIDLGGEIVEIL